MAKSQFVDFRAVKAAITMELVLEHYGLMDKFKRGKDSLNGPCPIHKGSNPTQFRVSISKNIWNCFSECQHGGNVLDFIAKMEDISIHAAALKAIEWFNLDPDEMAASQDNGETSTMETPAQAHKPADKPASQTKTTPGTAHENGAPNTPLKFRLDKLERNHPYLLEQRGLTPETIVDFGIGHCSKGILAGRIAIPIHTSKGEVVAYAGRYIGEPAEDTPKYKLPPGFRKSQELFNIDRAIAEPPDQPLVIVEGFFDAMRLHQHGYRKVVALMGATMSDTQEKLIAQHVHCGSRIIVMLDENEAGIAGREDIACRLSKYCFVKIHSFEQADAEPEHLSEKEIQQITGGGL
jgi:DNA primase